MEHKTKACPTIPGPLKSCTTQGGPGPPERMPAPPLPSSLNSISDCGGRHGWHPLPPACMRAQHRCELLFILQLPFPQFGTCKPGRACQRGRGCVCARQHQPRLLELVGNHKGNFQHKNPVPERERGIARQTSEAIKMSFL